MWSVASLPPVSVPSVPARIVQRERQRRVHDEQQQRTATTGLREPARATVAGAARVGDGVGAAAGSSAVRSTAAPVTARDGRAAA